MNIALLTSGGDSPGMNPCLAQLIKEGERRGHRIFGYRRGFLGVRDNDITELHTTDTASWYQRGGTVLLTGRFSKLSQAETQRELAGNLRSANIEVLVVLGGDGSFKGALGIHQAAPEIGVIGIPCTIDNNIYGSEYTLGFDTALNTQAEYIDGLYDTGTALPGRIFLVETLGAWDGYLPQSTLHMGMADLAVLCEQPVSDEALVNKIIDIHKAKQPGFTLVTFAEGDGSHRCIKIAKMLEEMYKVNVKCSLLGFSQRGGRPSACDRLMAAAFAKRALEAVDKGDINKYLVYNKGKISLMDITFAGQKKAFDWFVL